MSKHTCPECQHAWNWNLQCPKCRKFVHKEQVSDEKKFIHDCKECKFLGHAYGYDLYICLPDKVEHNLPSILARFGDEGHQYHSGIANMWAECLLRPEQFKEKRHKAYLEAVKLAYMKGLIKIEVKRDF
jgi:hypothetical protein